jgi:hypothetical protein
MRVPKCFISAPFALFPIDNRHAGPDKLAVGIGQIVGAQRSQQVAQRHARQGIDVGGIELVAAQGRIGRCRSGCDRPSAGAREWSLVLARTWTSTPFSCRLRLLGAR